MRHSARACKWKWSIDGSVNSKCYEPGHSTVAVLSLCCCMMSVSPLESKASSKLTWRSPKRVNGRTSFLRAWGRTWDCNCITDIVIVHLCFGVLTAQSQALDTQTVIVAVGKS